MRLRIALLGLVTSMACQALAADWPQWRGPHRDDVSQETDLLQAWPQAGPPLLWTHAEAGIGYSGPAVVEGILYSMGAWDDKEHVFALDSRTGKRVWATEIGSRFANNWGDGPRGTPTVNDGRVYAMGGQGTLVCLEAKTGRKVWSKNMRRDLKGRMMSGWGYTESPLVDGNLVLCTPGGNGGTIAALNKMSGKVVWRSRGLKDRAAYSSIIKAEVEGVPQFVQLTGAGVAGVSARNGKMLWHHPRPQHRTAVIPTPLFFDNHVYVTAGYNAGCDLLKLTRQGNRFQAEPLYANKNMVNHHGGVVRIGKYVYGYSDRPRGRWICQNFKTGKVVWEERRKLRKGSLTCADGRLYCYAEGDGTCVLIEATPKGWNETGRFKIPRQSTQRKPRGRIWTHPVVADSKLYLRDQDLIFCFDVQQKTAR